MTHLERLTYLLFLISMMPAMVLAQEVADKPQGNMPVTQDEAVSKPVVGPEMPPAAGAGVNDQEGLLFSPQVAPPATLPKAGSQVAGAAMVPQQEKIKDNYAWEGSVMFTADDISKITDAINQYELAMIQQKIRDQQFQGLLPGGQNPNAQVQIPPAPVFYLNSIAYDTEKLWSIWINNERITSKDKENYNKNGLKLVKIERDSVTFTWETDMLDLMVPLWQDKLDSPPESVLLAKKQPIKADQSFDSKLTTLEFTLHPNQSFVVANMQIIEGKLKTPIPAATQQQAIAATSLVPPAPSAPASYVAPAGLPSQGGSDVDPSQPYRTMKHIQERAPKPEDIPIPDITEPDEAKALLDEITTVPSQ